MRVVLLCWLILLLTVCGCTRSHGLGAVTSGFAQADAKTLALAASNRVDFHTQIKPILQQRCQPCHFSGGVMYQRLPFDRPETIKTLGTKLFTRLKDEKERELIRTFLSQ